MLEALGTGPRTQPQRRLQPHPQRPRRCRNAAKLGEVSDELLLTFGHPTIVTGGARGDGGKGEGESVFIEAGCVIGSICAMGGQVDQGEFQTVKPPQPGAIYAASRQL